MRRLWAAVLLVWGLTSACNGVNPIVPDTLVSGAGSGRTTDGISLNEPLIVDGRINLPSERPGTVSLHASNGFGLEAITLLGVEPNDVCRKAPLCLPGNEISLRGYWSGMDLPGSATLATRSYRDVGGLNSASSAEVELTGTFVAPPRADVATLTAPVMLSGRFISPDGTVRLNGAGTATLTLRWVANAPERWVIDDASVVFAK
jgi:hypothetical protein